MADYSSKYLFEARAVGVEKSANQLNKLATALNNLSSASNSAKGANVAGVVSGTGATGATGTGTGTGAATRGANAAGAYSPNSYIPSGPQIARALSYSAAIAGAYAVMGLVVGTTERWIDAQVEFNRVLIDTQNTLGGTTQDVADFADKIRYLSYLSGEAFSESSLVARREQILGRPGMGASAAGLNVVFGESLDLSTAAEDITAIQTQFGASFGDINDTLLALVQTSGITADELMSMSETWGALTDDLKLGGRNLDTMREIGALMASMSVVMGESGTVIETFLRKLERIYTDSDVGAALEGIGVSVRDASGEFRSLIDILDEISSRGLGAEAYDALQEFFPNQLGQKSKQQLREFFNQIDLITGIVDKAVDSTANFDEALVRANSSLDVLSERLGAAFKNWLTAVGDLSGASEGLAEIAAYLQNQATRLGPGGMDADKFFGGDGGYIPTQEAQDVQREFAKIVNRLFKNLFELGDTGREFVSSLPANFFGEVSDPRMQQEYLKFSLGQFEQSKYYNPEANRNLGAQDFMLFMSQHGPEVEEAFFGASEAARFSGEAYKANSEYIDIATISVDQFAQTLMGASSMVSMAFLGQGGLVATMSNLARVAGMFESADPFAQTPPYDHVGLTELNEINREPFSVDPYSYQAYSAVVADKEAADKLAEQQRALTERLARQQASDWDSLMNSMESSWDSMVSSLLKPTSVTAGDVALSKVGAYQDKWDEPLRRFRADINHLIKGEPEQYGSMERFKDYIDPNLLATAMGADQETKEALFRGIEDIVADKFLSLQMPAEMYNKDALISSARDWIAGEQQSKETRATMEGWLTEAGIDSEFAKMFLDDQGTPAIVKAMTGGWSPEQIQDEVGGSIPDIAGAVGDQFTEMDWAGMFASSVEASVTNDYQSLVSAGALLAKPIVEGAGDTIVETLVPRIIEAVAHYYD